MAQANQQTPATGMVAIPAAASGVPSTAAQSHTALYVGDLDYNVGESQLYEIFNRIGQVVSVRVCRDLVTKRSLGYAYVNYSSAQDAADAINFLNFMPVNGKSIRIMYSNRDATLRKSGTANIFIKNLDPSVDNKTLYDKFSVYGPILSCRVAVNAAGDSKGFGFVQFEQEESAENAINRANGMVIHERQVFVGPFVKKEERDLASGASKFSNVYVKNFSDATSDTDLREIFGAFGHITSAVVMRDADGNSKCFGFVNFENADDAAKAVESLNGKKINGKEWYVGRAQKKTDREIELRERYEQVQRERLENHQNVNLYLKNIDDNIDDGTLRELFSLYGMVTSCKIMRSLDGQSKGVGFVTFSFPDEAKKAVSEMNGKMVGSKPLYVAMAQRKEERQARMQAQFAQVRNPLVDAPCVAANLPPMYHPGAPVMGRQVFYGQPHPGLIPPQPNGFGYQQPMVPGMGPGAAQIPNYFMPAAPRPTLQSQRMGRRGGGAPVQPQQSPLLQQQMFPRGSNRSMRYSQSPRNPSDTVSSPEIGGASSSAGMNLPTTALSSSLAAASPEQQRVMLGEQLYPLVEQLEHDRAGKVTGMLLELDQTEVLHLIESPEALRTKVAEAMDVLQMSQAGTVPGVDIVQLASLSLNNEPLGS